MLKTNRKELYVISGPNGAGKTTFALRFLPDISETQFINADMIARGVSPLSPETASVEAGKLFIGKIRELAHRKESFAFETTLSGKAYIRLFKQMKKMQYRLYLIYLWVPKVSIAVDRIADRVKMGGHNIPEVDVERRYKRGLKNLFTVYRKLFDATVLLDNSQTKTRFIAVLSQESDAIFDNESYNLILKKMRSL